MALVTNFMKFKITLTTVLKFLGSIILLLLVLNLACVWMQYVIEDKKPFHIFFIRLFDFNQEANIPSFFSSLLLLTVAVLLYFIYRYEKKTEQKAMGWQGLALVFTFLSIDEATEIHEFLIGYFRTHYEFSGYFYYAWIIPYSTAMLLLGLVYIPFFKRLDGRIFILMMVSGAIFIAGAIGMEMLGGNTMENEGFGLRYMIFYTIEETLEMAGVSLFIFSLLRFLAGRKKNLSFKLKPSGG